MKKLHYIMLGVLLAVFVMIASALLIRGQAWGDDFAGYIMQAKSIVNGTERQTVEQNLFAINNSSVEFGPSAYPWGYPLVLALYYRIFGLNLLALNSVNILFLCFFIILFFVLLRNRLSPLEAVLVTAVVAFTPEVITFENNITSDIAFLCLSTLCLLLIDRFLSGQGGESASLGKGAVLGAALFLAFFFRAVGVLILITLLACQVIVIFPHWRKQDMRKGLLINYLVPYLVFGILLGISAILFPASQGSVNDSLAFLIKSFSLSLVKDHAWSVFHFIDQVYFASLHGPLIVYGFLLAFFMIGILARVEKDYAFIIYSVLTLLVVLIYPRINIRYSFPVFPFFVYFSFQGMKTGFMGLREAYRRAGLAFTYLFWIVVLLFFAGTLVNLARANLTSDQQVAGPFDAQSTEMFNFIKNSTPPDSVIVFFKPRAMRLITDRNAITVNQCDQFQRGNFAVFIKDNYYNPFPVEKFVSCGLQTTQVFENENFIAFQLMK